MAEPEIRGTRAPVLNQSGSSFDPEQGLSLVQEWRGLGLQQMLDLQNQLSAQGIKNEVSYQNGVAVLHAYNTTTNVTIDTWTIGQNELQKSSLENPRNIANITPTRLLTLAKFQQNIITYDQALAAFQGGTDSPQAMRALDRFVKGQTDYAASGYVLRHTNNVPNRYASNVADFAIDCIYTTAQLLSEVQSTNWVYPLPGRLAFKIQFLSAPPGRSFYQWGWLKRGSTESTAANNRINITTEWWLDQWSTDEYALAF